MAAEPVDRADLITSAALTEKAKLRKHFGRFDIFFFLICTIIGVDTLGRVAVEGAQGFLWLIFLAIFFFVPYALIVAELGAAFTEEGGAYIWTRMAWGRLVAGTNAIFYWFSNPVWAFSYRMATPKRLGMAGPVYQGCRESSCGAYPGGTCGILRGPSFGKKVRQTASVSQTGSPSGATLSAWSCCSPSGHSQSPKTKTGSDHSSRRLQLPSSRLGSHSPTNCAKRPGGAATIWRMRGLSWSLMPPPFAVAGRPEAAPLRSSNTASRRGRTRQAPDRPRSSGTGGAAAAAKTASRRRTAPSTRLATWRLAGPVMSASLGGGARARAGAALTSPSLEASRTLSQLPPVLLLLSRRSFRSWPRDASARHPDARRVRGG